MTLHDGIIGGIAGRGRAVNRRFPRRAAVRASAQSAAFVARLLGRHGVAPLPATGDVREFRRERRLAGPVSHQHWHSTWSPRFVLSLMAATGRGSDAPGNGVLPDHIGASDSFAPMPARMAMPTAARFARIDRLAPQTRQTIALPADGARLPLRSDPGPGVERTAEAALPTTSLPRVLRRPSPVAVAMPAAAPATPASTPAFASPLERYAAVSGSMPAMPSAMTAIDVEGLADRVVRVIDRRLVASRERHGRI